MEAPFYKMFNTERDIWHTYHMAALLPIIDSSADIKQFRWFVSRPQKVYGIRQFEVDYAYNDINVYGSMVSNVSSSWNQANTYCRGKGGRLFTLDSYEQWHILMENMGFAFQRKHHNFWMSALVFLGSPEIRKVCSEL